MGMTTRKQVPLRRVFVGLIIVASLVLALTTATVDGIAKRTVPEKPLMTGSNVPAPVRSILKRACQDCHSENTVWPWYSHIPPISQRIHSDVERGRAFMDLSEWSDYTETQQRGYTAAIGAAIQDHLMPPPMYVRMHREARLSSEELELVRAWVLAEHKTARKQNLAKPASSSFTNQRKVS
jgi:Haem-binding domain